MSKVYCRYCGQQIDENASFCTYCGKALEHEEDAHWLVNSYYYRGLAKMKLLNLAGVYKDLEHAKELGNEKAEDELDKIDASSLDFSKDGTFKVLSETPHIQKPMGGLTIEGIEKTNEYTAVHVSFTNTKYDEGGWYAIYRESYLRDRSTGTKYTLVTTKNCAVLPNQTPIKKGSKAYFTLYYSPIPKETTLIDFIDSEDSEWKYYGIELKKTNED